MILRGTGPLTGQIGPQNQGDRQPLDFRFPVGRESYEEPIGGHGFILITHAENFLHITTVFEKEVGGRRKDESLNLGEFDTLERLLESSRNGAVHGSYQ